MPGALPSRRRAFNTRGRGGLASRRRVLEEQQDNMDEPPKKRRKYVPGGPGGGGHFQDREGQTTLGDGNVTESAYTSRREGRGLRNIATTGTAAPSERPNRPRRERRAPQQEPLTRPRYSSAAAAAAAAVQGDGFKPREERGWEEFHEHLEIDAKLPVFASGLVDGTIKPAEDEDEDLSAKEQDQDQDQDNSEPSGMKRRPGRPPRSQSAMLKGIGIIDAPRAVPIPGPNPREKLTLPRPSFKAVDPFASYEKANGSIDYVDRPMASVGYQESDLFDRPDQGLIRWSEDNIDEEMESLNAQNGEHTHESSLPRVEYDMDEQDQKWLENYNAWRKTEGAEGLKPAYFEITMTKIEKEWHALEKRIPKPNPKPPQTHRPRSSSAAAVNGEPVPDGEEQDTKCAICDDGDCENTNAIVFCDGCDLAVHQECYGVPFIPEGQWLCRKCHLIGSGTPTCVFCPNTDGAFKQTNSARWAHLLCAIWIPEVSLGNTTFMEPVMDVEKVPKSRWRLTCDICKQKMGACIQCSHKACYTAFHVTCAKRARWYVSMKSSQGGSANLDSSLLRAYCGNHVSEDWAQACDTNRATRMARKYYKKAMRGKIWADSHQAAQNLQAMQPLSPPAQPTYEEVLPKITLSLGSNKKKKNQPPARPMWKLPSGAPVIPASLFSSVDTALLRFSLRKRREFAADMCKYWTLKREAKRGAALIKRLQLQMETFSAMEITRRNFAGMGAIGRSRLQRRIEFAEERIRELDSVRELCSLLKDREEKKLQNAELLRDVVDTVYFPIPSLLWPAVEKAERHDIKDIFKNGLSHIRQRLEQRGYASVAPISADLGSVFAQVMTNNAIEASHFTTTSNDDTSGKRSGVDDKSKRAMAKRILKAIQPTLEDALRKESELNQMPLEDTLLDLGQLLEKSVPNGRSSGGILGRVDHTRAIDIEEDLKIDSTTQLTPDQKMIDADSVPQSGITSVDNGKPENTTIDEAPPVESVLNTTTNPDTADIAVINTTEVSKPTSPHNHLTPASIEAVQLDDIDVPAPVHDLTSHETSHTEGDPVSQPQQAPTPPLSTNSSHLAPQQVVLVHAPDKITPLSLGGVPWYMQDFEPSGLTFYQELRNDDEAEHTASEDLSEIDDDELDGIAMEVDAAEEAVAQSSLQAAATSRARNKGASKARKNSRAKGRTGGRSRVSR